MTALLKLGLDGSFRQFLKIVFLGFETRHVLMWGVLDGIWQRKYQLGKRNGSSPCDTDDRRSLKPCVRIAISNCPPTMIVWLCVWFTAWASADPLTLLCWNIHHGRGMDGRIDLERIAGVIAAAKPDVVALQEVDQATRRSEGIDQAAVLAEMLGMKSGFGRAMDFEGGSYGLAVLSRLPMKTWKVHRLPGDGEARIGFEVLIQHTNGDIRVVCTHLDHGSEASRVAQVAALCQLLTHHDRVVICGDLNDVPGSAALTAFGDSWRLVAKNKPALTFPADEPRVEIDHFLVRGLNPIGRPRVKAESIASDHRPIIGKFE